MLATRLVSICEQEKMAAAALSRALQEAFVWISLVHVY